MTGYPPRPPAAPPDRGLASARLWPDAEGRAQSAVRLYSLSALATAVGWTLIAAYLTPASDPTGFIRVSPDWQADLVVRVVWFLGLAALAFVPREPLIGVFVYCLLAYGFPRYTPTYQFMLQTHLLELAACVTLAGWTLHATFERSDISPLRRWPGRLLLGLICWVGICWFVGASSGRIWQPAWTQHPLRFFNAGVMFLVSATCLTERRQLLWFCLLLSGLPLVRAAVAPRSVVLDGDLAALVVTVLPLAIAAATVATWLPARGAGAVVAAGLVGLLMASQNRGALVAVGPTLVALWAVSSRKLLWAGCFLVGLVPVAAVFSQTDYATRFTVLLERGIRSGSAGERLILWTAGLEMVREYPVFGVGPGNFEATVGRYAPGMARYGPHNTFVAMAAQTGVPGLLVFSAFFAVTLGQAWWAASKRRGWGARAAGFVAASLVAYLAAGLFIARPTQTLAYALAGAAAALATAAPRAPSSDGLRENGEARA